MTNATSAGFITILIICVATNSHSVNTDEQTVIKIDGLQIKDSVFHENGSWPIVDAARVVFTRWTPWSKCYSCTQQRTMQRVYGNATLASPTEFEERPCRRSTCLRLWHKRRLRRRMRVIKINPKQLKHAKAIKYIDINPNRRKSRIWSKWSTWSKCSKSCQTERYKVCKKPGRCSKMKKYEKALCFHPNSPCERTVNRHLAQYNIHEWDRLHQPVTTTKAPVYTPRMQQDGGERVPGYKQQCGRPLRKHSMLKIKGGRDANRDHWPWHIAVVNQHNETFCSGTLIAPKWVLTAAHCIRSKLKIRLNEFDLWQPDGEIEITVERTFRHYGFDRRNIDNDIGLLYLSRAVKTPVACLPSQKEALYQVDTKCTILGWGAKDASRDHGGYHILQEAKLPIVHRDKCINAYSDYYISDNMFCAGYPTGEIDTCAGDSGGGLLCRTWDRNKNNLHGRPKFTGYIIQGITSFGDACGKPHRYGIYANVSNYLDWIHHTMTMATRHQRYHHTASKSPKRYHPWFLH